MNKIKKLIGIPVIIHPIVDSTHYVNREYSYSGASLVQKNTLIVSDYDYDKAILYNRINTEGLNHACLMIDKEHNRLNESEIILQNKEMLGPFTNIINLFNVLSGSEDDAYEYYHILQEEVAYLVDNEIMGTITTVIYYDESLGLIDRSVVSGLKGLIEGLGTKLPNHGIICNGVIASYDVPFEVVVNTAFYMSGKFGCILNGEVMELKERNEQFTN